MSSRVFRTLRHFRAIMVLVPLGTTATAHASECLGRKSRGCSALTTVVAVGAAGERVTGPQASSSDQLYGLAVRERAFGTARQVDEPMSFRGFADVDLFAHGSGGPPGGELSFGGGLGFAEPFATRSRFAVFSRLGLASLFRIDRYETRYRFVLPTIELGVAAYSPNLVSELNLVAGLDSYRVEKLEVPGRGDDVSRIGVLVPSVGGATRVMKTHFSLELELTRSWPRTEPGAFSDRAKALLCTGAWYVGVCGEGELTRLGNESGDVNVRAARVGVLIGFGGPFSDLD